MTKRFNRGFTLIELLVVIAIIGILSSVVLASLNSARSKGADAAVKSNLNNTRPQAEILYDAAGSYAAVCADVNNMQKALEAASMAGTGAVGNYECNNSATAWAASSPLKSTDIIGAGSGTDHWCVDSTGTSKAITDALGAGVTVCP